jgi:hypothetical protein
MREAAERCTVCLTFDVDAYNPWLYKGPSDPSSLSRGEFDATIGVPRILRLPDDYGITGTFFVPGHTADAFPRCVELIAAGGHEIAHHGYCHEPPARLSASEEEAALIKGIEALRRITGERPNGYRSAVGAERPNVAAPGAGGLPLRQQPDGTGLRAVSPQSRRQDHGRPGCLGARAASSSCRRAGWSTTGARSRISPGRAEEGLRGHLLDDACRREALGGGLRLMERSGRGRGPSEQPLVILDATVLAQGRLTRPRRL